MNALGITRACGTPFALCLSLRGRDARKLSRPEISIDTSGIAIGKQFSVTSYWGNSIHRVFHLIILQAMTTAAFPLHTCMVSLAFSPPPFSHFDIRATKCRGGRVRIEREVASSLPPSPSLSQLPPLPSSLSQRPTAITQREQKKLNDCI